MPRAKRGVKARKRRNTYFKAAKGQRGGRSRLTRTVIESVEKSWAYAYTGRKQKKLDYRALWINRISAALRGHDLSYSKFIGLLGKAQISLNRKVLAFLAAEDQKSFDSVVGLAKQAA